MTATRRRSGGRSSSKGSSAKRSSSKGSSAKRSSSKGSSSKGSSSKGSTTKRSTSKGSSARRSTTKGSSAKRSTARKRSASGRGGELCSARPAPRSTRSSRSRRSSGESGNGRRRGRRRPTLKVTDVGERNAAYLATVFVGLTLFGLVMVLSASSVSSLHEFAQSPFYQFKRQVAWSVIGAVAFIGASLIDYRRIQRFAGPLMVLCVVALGALLVPGVGLTRNGSTRWLGAGGFVVQPSELTKLAMILFVADLLARRGRRMDRPELTVRPVMFVLFLVSGLMALQPKLGTRSSSVRSVC